MSFNKESKMYAYMVRNEDLPEITKEMNGVWDNGVLKCRVVKINIISRYEALILVEKTGSYPVIENEWEKYFLKPKK